VEESIRADCTAERCEEISQRYAFFAYPWDSSHEMGRTLKACGESSHPFRMRRWREPFNRGLRSLVLA